MAFWASVILIAMQPLPVMQQLFHTTALDVASWLLRRLGVQRM